MDQFAVFDRNNKLRGVIDSTEQIDGEVHLNITNPTDKLQTMLDLQSLFQARLNCGNSTQDIMNQVLYAEAEMHEFLRELEGFKAWKHYDWNEEEQKQHLAAAKEEFIDVLHFIWNIAIAMGMTSDEIFSIFVEKNMENHRRQDNNY